MFQDNQQEAYETVLKNEKTDRANDAYMFRKTGLPFGVPSGIFQEKSHLAMPEYSDLRANVIQNMIDEMKEVKENPEVIDRFRKRVGFEESAKEQDDENEIWEVWNEWTTNDPKSSGGRKKVIIFRNKDTGKKIHQIHQIVPGYKKSYDFLVDSLDMSARYHDHTGERKANRKLRKLLRPPQIRQLDLTGCFVENETKSGMTYLLRKGRPTIAFRMHNKSMYFIAALCMHPLGYYSGTFAGHLVPSDELMTHLIMARSDEHTFWKRANHHSLKDVEAGL